MSKTIRLDLSRISGAPQVAQVSVSQAGLAGRAVESLGRTVSQVGQQVGNIVQRRRDEEDRDIISSQSSMDKLLSQDESNNLKQGFIDNGAWRGYADEVTKVQLKRQQRLLKNVPSQKAREALESNFEISRLKSSLAAVSWERNQFTKVSINNIEANAKLSAQADFQSPPDLEEFKLELSEELLDIRNRDLDPETISKISEDYLNTRMKGAILGHTDGGQLQDFQRAKDLLNSMKDEVSPDKFAKFDNLIASRQLKIQERANRAERQETIFLEKQFKAEINELDDLVETINENPDADVQTQLTRLSAAGKLDVSGTPRLMSRIKMGTVQREVSDNIRFNLLDALSETDDLEDIRDEFMQATLSGQLSTEDASSVLKSLNVRSNSKYARNQFKIAKDLVKGSSKPVTTPGDRRTLQKQQQAEMMRDIEALSVESSIDPVKAAKIVLKDRGLLTLQDIPTVKGAIHNQDTLEGLEEIRKDVFRDIRSGLGGKLREKINFDKLELIQRRIMALEIIPTLEEAKRSGR